ncbi:DUF397 domain-containing protein [Streptomyces rugosispiralis]|uniref:DUF397 domain-containing protein n=1 Tax=Streptomyces rugosispiralis TaxID=2967341 RepID=A0ABT1V0X7_9ACTN|nr:DUF397 domain-containing protein [Streptomyces rugosispiralis]MCQ8191037.1 DUF397 domain-containing protein [Streptomyces rugosispiralis]
MSTPRDTSYVGWVKSSYSNGGGGSCVEWAPAFASTGAVPVRDSKDPNGPALVFPASSWSSFISAVKDGELHGA